MVEITVYLLKTTAGAILLAVEAAMLLRALLSFLNPESDGLLAALVYYISEPLIVPVRWVLDRFGLSDGLPFDLAFMVTSVLLVVAEMFVFGV